MIRIGKLTDYGIVLLAHMARNAHLCVHPATDLSEETGVPLPTAQKILKVLGASGLVESRRGARGGYALVHDPAHTSLVMILEAMEGPIGLTECSAGGGCAEHVGCPVGDHWPLINGAVRSALAAVTLLELSRSRPVLRPRPAARRAHQATDDGVALMVEDVGSPDDALSVVLRNGL